MKKIILFAIGYVCVFSNIALAQEGSDCPNAVVVNALPFNDPSFTTIPPDPIAPTTCNSGNNFGPTNACGNNYTTQNDFYYRFTPTTAADACINVSITTAYSAVDNPPSLFIIEGCPNTLGSKCIAQELEPRPVVANTTPTITVTINNAKLVVGRTYYIVASGLSTTATGAQNCYAFTTAITRSTTCNPTIGDDCFNAQIINTLPFSSANETNCNNKDFLTIGNICASTYADGRDKVYKIVPDSDYCARISVTSDEFYKQMALYDRCPTDDRSGCITSVTFGNPMAMNANFIEGREYYLVISTDSNYSVNPNDCMNYTLDIQTFDDKGKTCPDAIDIPSLPYTQQNSTICKGDNYDNLVGCISTFYHAGEEIIYTYTSPGNECVGFTATHMGGNFTSGGLYVYSSCPELPGATCLGADIVSSFGSPAFVEYTFTGPQKVYIVVSSSSQTSQVDFTLDVREFTIPGKNCANPISIPSLPFSDDNATACKGDDFDNRACPGPGAGTFYQAGREAVYTYNSPGNECIGIKLNNVSTTGGVYIFDRCPEDPAAVCLGSVASFVTDNTSFNVTLTTAQTYYIVVSNAYLDENLEYSLQIDRYNDVGSTCDNPITISSLPFEQRNSTLCKGNDYNTPGSCTRNFYQNLNGNEIVYTYTSPGSECLSLTIADLTTDYSTVYIFDRCPSDPAAQCVAFDYKYPLFDGSKAGDYQFEISNTAATTYYIVISSQFYDENPDFTLRINAVLVDPLGADCPNAVIIPSIPFTGNYNISCKGNDYTTTNLAAAGPFLNGNDVVLKFTLAQRECLVFNTKMSYRGGFFLTNNCPNVAGVQLINSGVCEAQCDSLVLEQTLNAGTYYIILSGYQGVIDMDFVVNIKRNGVPQVGANCIDCDDNVGCTQCANAGLERGTFANWAAAYGTYATPNQTTGFVSSNINNPLSRHTIVSAGGHDPVVGPELKFKSPIGSRYVLRLGNRDNGAEAEQLRFTYNVTADSKNFYYYYAIVFDDPGHGVGQNPYLNFRMYDQLGQEITCARYEVYANKSDTNYKRVDRNIFNEYYTGISYYNQDVVWRDWTLVAVPLDAYVGQSITMEFTTKDCAASAHFGYCYLDAYCGSEPFQTSSQFLCDGSNLTISAPPGFVSYLWDTGENTRSIDVNIARTYLCRVTTVTNCTYDIQVNVQGGRRPIPEFNYAQAECSDSVAALTHQISFAASDTSRIQSVSWDFRDGSPVSNQLNPLHTFANGPGVYNVNLLVMSSNGCSANITKQVTIVDKAAIPELILDDSIKLCQGQNLQLNSTAVSSANYQWTGPGSFSSTLQNPTRNNVVQSNSGKYLLSVNLQNCPPITDSVYVDINTFPVISKSPDPTVCADTSGITLSASGAQSYAWYAAASGGSPLATTSSYYVDSLSSSRSYFVSGANAQCVANRQEIKITVNPIPPTPSASPVTLCAGKDTFITASNGGFGTIEWYDSPSSGNLINNTNRLDILNPQTSRMYYLRAIQAGCKSTYSQVALTVKDIPNNPNAASSTICSGQSTTLTNTDVMGTTVWFDNASGTNVVYSGASYQTPILNSTKVYYLQNQLNGCNSSILPVNVEVVQRPDKPSLSNGVICSGESATLTGTSNIGTITWYDSPSSTTPIFTGASFNTGNLNDTTQYYALSNYLGCISDRERTEVIVKPLPATPVIVAVDSICNGNAWDANIQNINGLGIYTWTLPDNSELVTSNLSLTPNQSGIYKVKVEVDGCESGLASKFVHVILIDDANFNYSKATYCVTEGTSLPIITGKLGGTFTQQTGPGLLRINPSTGLITFANSKSGTHTIHYQTFGFCPASSTQQVIIDTINEAYFAYNDPYCQIGPNTQAIYPKASILGTSVAGVFSANNAGLNFSNTSTGEIDLSSSQPGNYTVTNSVTSVNACPDAAYSKTVTILRKPNDPSPQVTSPICEGESFTLSVPDDFGGSVHWNGPDGFVRTGKTTLVTNAQIGVHDVATYTAYVKLGICLSEAKAAKPLKIDALPTALFNYVLSNVEDNEVNVGDTVILKNQSSVGNTYTWKYGDGSDEVELTTLSDVQHIYLEPGDYLARLTVESPVKCLNTSTLVIPVKAKFRTSPDSVINSKLNVGNAFSPNGDGVNDEFEFRLDNIRTVTVKVFNRWGEMLYEGSGSNPTWDGLRNGTPVLSGVYVYRYTAIGLDDKEYSGFGTVTVVP